MLFPFLFLIFATFCSRPLPPACQRCWSSSSRWSFRTSGSAGRTLSTDTRLSPRPSKTSSFFEFLEKLNYFEREERMVSALSNRYLRDSVKIFLATHSTILQTNIRWNFREDIRWMNRMNILYSLQIPREPASVGSGSFAGDFGLPQILHRPAQQPPQTVHRCMALRQHQSGTLESVQV